MFFKNMVVFYFKRRRLFLKGGDLFLQTWVQYKYSFVKALYRSFIKTGFTRVISAKHADSYMFDVNATRFF